MREQDWRANYYEAIRERNEAEAKLDLIRAIVDRVAADPSNATDELWVYSIRKALGEPEPWREVRP